MRPRRRAEAWLLFALCLATADVAAWANDKSAALFEDGRRKLRRRDVAGAAKALTDAVAADPDDADAQILCQDVLHLGRPDDAFHAEYRARSQAKPDDPLLAYLAARLLKPEDAAREFDKIQSRFPDFALAHEGRAAALSLLPRDKDRDKEITDEVDKAVAAGPRDARCRVALARNFERLGEWRQAVETWWAAADQRPKDLPIALGLGEALRRSGALDDAATQFEAAAKLDPSDPEPPYRLGLTRHDAARHDDALKQFDAAIALDKGYVDAYCAAVRTCLAKVKAAAAAAKRDAVETDFVSAIDYGTRAVATDAASVAAHVALGNAQEATTEVSPSHADAALKEYDAALGLAAATGEVRVRVLSGKAYVLWMAGRFDEALKVADAAVEQDDHAVAAYLCGGRALSSKGLFADAIKKYYGPGLKAVADDARLRHARGVALWQLGKVNDARKDLEAAAQSDPTNGRFQLTLGEMYYDLKMYKQAATALITATDQRPADPSSWRLLGRAHTALKDYEHAAEAFEQVVALVEGAAPAPKPDVPAPGGDPAAPTPPPAPTPPVPGGQPPAPPGGDAPKPADPGGAGKDAPKSAFATSEHLELAVLYSDHLNMKDKAKAHAKKFVDQGGTNANLDDWIQNLISGN